MVDPSLYKLETWRLASGVTTRIQHQTNLQLLQKRQAQIKQ